MSAPTSSAREPSPRRPSHAHSVILHRVGFYQTDAMGIMHHANYLHLLETARVCWLEEHHEPYARYVERGLHFAVTSVEVQYLRSARFDNQIRTYVWLEWLRGASLGIAYELEVDGELLARARTRHAMVDASGKPVRIPGDQRRQLASLLEAAAEAAHETGVSPADR